jgi:hypothetical protein
LRAEKAAAKAHAGTWSGMRRNLVRQFARLRLTRCGAEHSDFSQPAFFVPRRNKNDFSRDQRLGRN